MLCRSGPLDNEELKGGRGSVYVLSMPRTRKETVCDSCTLREKGVGGDCDERVPMIFKLVKTSLTDCCTALPSFQEMLNILPYIFFITRQGNQT